ncbi:uncharacterized protein LOC102719638 [Oryza brachyantha]|uniref:Uncharacterized protein n=1 Tax=Oryza brachyantha TaxID=4533 RepID=J3NDA5_ORYBR|nr:uncharacterized protein LOC102719638 [Oryza brachyantha]
MAMMITNQLLVFTIAILVILLVAAPGAMSQESCTAPSSIDVQQSNTGEKVGTFDTMFEVTVTNRCTCVVNAVVLRADGFASSVAVDPMLFRQAGDTGYLLGDGRRIQSAESVTFQYAWDHYFDMAPASMQAEC